MEDEYEEEHKFKGDLFIAIIFLFFMAFIIVAPIVSDVKESKNIAIAEEQGWEWFYNGQPVDRELVNVYDYNLTFDYEHCRVLMSDK